MVGLAGEEVAAARAAVAEEPVPAWRRSSSAQSSGAEQAMMRPVSFSTQRNAGMFSFEPRRIPAWLAPVCDEVGLPLEEAVGVVGEPARHRGSVPVPHRPLEHGLGEPVDLEEEDPRLVRLRPLPGAPGDRWMTRIV